MRQLATLLILFEMAFVSTSRAADVDLQKSVEQARAAIDKIGWDLGKVVEARSYDVCWEPPTGKSGTATVVQVDFEGGIIQLLEGTPFRLGRREGTGKQVRFLPGAKGDLHGDKVVQLAREAVKAAGQEPFPVYHSHDSDTYAIVDFVRKEEDAWILPDVQRVGLNLLDGSVQFVELAPSIQVPEKPDKMLAAKDSKADSILVVVPDPKLADLTDSKETGRLRLLDDGPEFREFYGQEARLLPNASFLYAWRRAGPDGFGATDFDAATGERLYDGDGYRAVRGPIQIGVGAIERQRLQMQSRPWRNGVAALAGLVALYVLYRIFRARRPARA